MREPLRDVACVLLLVALCALGAPLLLLVGEPTPEEDYALHKRL